MMLFRRFLPSFTVQTLVAIGLLTVFGVSTAKASRDRVGDWDVVCQNRSNGAAASCRIVQLLEADDDSRFKVATIFSVGESNLYSMQVVTPNDVSLQDGIAIEIDTGFRAELNFEHCASDGCVADGTNANELLSELIGGGRASYKLVRHSNGKPIYLDVSLNGFTVAALIAFSGKRSVVDPNSIVASQGDRGSPVILKSKIDEQAWSEEVAQGLFGYVLLGYSHQDVRWGGCNWTGSLGLNVIRNEDEPIAKELRQSIGIPEGATYKLSDVVATAAGCGRGTVNVAPVLLSKKPTSMVGDLRGEVPDGNVKEFEILNKNTEWLISASKAKDNGNITNTVDADFMKILSSAVSTLRERPIRTLGARVAVRLSPPIHVTVDGTAIQGLDGENVPKE